MKIITVSLRNCAKFWEGTEPGYKDIKAKFSEIILANRAVINLEKNDVFNLPNLNYNQLTNADVIIVNYFYSVFKRALEDEDQKFIEEVTKQFFTSNNRSLSFIRSMNDGVFDKRFDLTVTQTIRELSETRHSVNLTNVIDVLQCKHDCQLAVRFDEALKFVKPVITSLFEKESLNTDVTLLPRDLYQHPSVSSRNQIKEPVPHNTMQDATRSS